jgi:hypothetical protein
LKSSSRRARSSGRNTELIADGPGVQGAHPAQAADGLAGRRQRRVAA